MQTIDNVSETARQLFCSREEVRRLTARGVLKEEPSGGYDRDKARCNYITHLRETRARQSEKWEKLNEAKTKLAELRYAKETNKLADVEVMTNGLLAIVSWFVNAIEGLPGAIRQARADRGLREELQKWVFNTRTALADRTDGQVEAMSQGKAADIWAP